MLGAAAIATVMNGRIGARITAATQDGSGPVPGIAGEHGAPADLPETLHAPFAAAMADALLLPVVLALVGVVAAFAIGKPLDSGAWEKEA